MKTLILGALPIIAILLLATTLPTNSSAQSSTPYAYDIGSPALVDYYVNPSTGSDENSGRTESAPVRTVQKIWNGIPQSTQLSTGVRINLENGDYGDNELPNYWENRLGSSTAPIIIRAKPGNSSVRFTRDINMAGVRYFYLLNVEIAPRGGGDTFHCERCDHILLRGNTLNGGSLTNGAHETVKVNQSQYVYLENNNIFFADDNAIDYVGVQYGHIVGNKIHSAQDWCIYVKGGSAYLRIEANEIYNCGTGGFTAGQGTGFQFMTSPWLHYEAYDVKFINNLIYNTEGAAFGVNGGYNILLAHNTAYNVGKRSHLIEVVFGERTCDGATDGSPNSVCEGYNSEGGWGAPRTKTTPDYVGNRNVFILNNIVANPAGTTSPQHFAVYAPRVTSPESGIPSPQRTDTNLVIKGNIIQNGSSTHPLGVGESSDGCQAENPTCNPTQILNDNRINNLQVQFQGVTTGDLRPVSGDLSFSFSPANLDSFPGGDREGAPLAPLGELLNVVMRDFSGAVREAPTAVGAFSSANSVRDPQSIEDSPTPGGPGDSPSSDPMVVGKIAVSQQRNKKKVILTITANVQGGPTSVQTLVKRKSKTLVAGELAALNTQRFKGKVTLKVAAKSKLTVVVTAISEAGSVTSQRNIVVK
jgi:hypothetical protein